MGKFGSYQREIRLQSLSLTLIKTRAKFLRIITTIWVTKGKKARITKFQQGIIEKGAIRMLPNTSRLVLNANIGTLEDKKSLFFPLP